MKEKIYTIRVTESFTRDIEVPSASAADALVKAKVLCDREPPLFSSGQYAGTKFRIKGLRRVAPEKDDGQ